MQRRIVYHIAFWLIYLIFKTIQNIGSDLAGEPGSLSFPQLKMLFTAQLAFLIVKIPLVYSLFNITKKYLAAQWGIAKTILTGVLLFILSLAVFILVKQFIVISGIYKIKTGLSAAFNFVSIFSGFVILFFVSSIALAIKLVRINMRQKEIEKEILKTKLETELRFLKAQTNPHFLFNTLNNIYALARKKSDLTAEVVMKLSKLLRFMLYESQKKTIPLSEEILVVEHYIELEKIRHNSKLHVDFIQQVDNHTRPVAPLLLLPFVENAFKHGAGESRFDSYIKIYLTVLTGELNFQIENSKTPGADSPVKEQIGLTNVQRQLQLLYPAHNLTIENGKTSFKVNLKLIL
jgi:two-component system, LytTR family, sensor kinase